MLKIIVDREDFSQALAILADHGYVTSHNQKREVEIDGNVSMEETGSVILKLTRAGMGRRIVKNYNEEKVLKELKAANINYT